MRARGRASRALLLAVLVALSLGACAKAGAGDDGAAVSTPAGKDAAGRSAGSADQTATAGKPAATEQPGAGGEPTRRSPKEFAEQPLEQQSSAKARLVGLDAGRGKGVETVTFTFADTKVLPSYRVAYVDAIRAHPEDDPIPMEGKAFLEVSFSLTNPNTRGRLAVPPDLAPDQPLVKSILLARNLAGSLGFGVGLEKRSAFRVRELHNPTRLIVEVRAK
ncbi:AMIN-like domain-containing (lipo)protein [Actinopolymorpha alba]|uniref:AMIN-like domain-containing (lipo)protein n=1 Tax=Actinopolymorpha alba TaxID=533267 RepID=UPI00036A7F1B|nr:hypothetical protein [Actinopolymorpha alba]